MNHRERIEHAIAGKETDRLPYSLWWHFPNKDRMPRRLAELAIHYQEALDLDFIKYMPYGMFSTIDWGTDLKVFEGFGEPPVAANFPIATPEDWDKITPRCGTSGEYAIVLESQRIALKELHCQVPIVQTVFSPLTTALKMAGEETLKKHLVECPEKVHKGLEVITETTKEFALAAVENGAAGVFFSTQMASRDRLNETQLNEFMKKYDRVILDAIKDTSWFNVLHIHGSNIYFEELLDYPIQVLNWHDRDDGPSMEEARAKTDRCFCGGLSHKHTLPNGTEEELRAQVQDTWKHNDGKAVIFAPGCVVNPNTSDERLLLVKKLIEETAR